ncbi:MAG: lytic transglycosylase domain-containing protein [Acidobacteria bacterium]|nr:lytic transglycosylase domain-containing protein [Acidobacteriota bacterium]
MTLVAVALAACFPAAASAQIYSWRDENGRLVLSDRPLGAVARTYGVRESAMIRSTRRVSIVRVGQIAQYDPLIREHAAREGVRADLVRAVIQTESGFNPFARSSKGALGLMQLMPRTASELGVVDPFDPEQNIRGGVTYLRQLIDRYRNNEELALAAYNAGPTAVDRYGSVPPYRETRNYVARVRGRTAVTTRSGSTRIYRTVEVIDGREVVRYSDRPSSR